MHQKFEEITDDVDLKPCRMSAATDQDFSHDSDEEQTHQRRPYAISSYLNRSTMYPLKYAGCCFLIGFFFLFFINYYVIDILLESSQNILFRIATLFFCVGHPLSYISTALSNPGVITQSVPETPNTNYCKKCKMNVPHHARHCDQCGVCIEYFDHHCPTYSKCIGGGNKIQFYSFIIMTPIYMLFTVVSFMFLMSKNLAKIENMSKSL